MFPTPGKLFLFIFLLVSCSASKQTIKSETDPTLDNLKSHIQYLADDKLEGRRTGTHGEELAKDYITEQFKKIGLIPKGTEYYPQSFLVNDGKQIGPASYFYINDKELIPGKDFFPFPFSPDQLIEALPAISLLEADMPWFYDLGETLEENKDNPHFDLAAHISTYVKKAQDKRASAVILYNTSAINDKLVFDPKDRTEETTIPVLYISKEIAVQYFSDKSASLKIKFRSDVGIKNRQGYNVIGYIDNNAATTVILGAHFDHLGYGEDGNSMLRTGEHLVHNGADDNASGTAALIELARKLKNSPAKGKNYLFIAFSGEELGLFGSKYFIENPTIDLATVDYMINMDMVGRLNDSSHVLTIGGYGTSPTWSTVISKDYFDLPNADKKTAPALAIRFDSSGTGPSDHTSFYRKDIPVLFYFTGLHTDYHKPTDDADKINYYGETKIIQHILSVIESLDKSPKLVFTKTRETQTGTNQRFSVSLGIMPDYTFAGSGVRADGVTDGKAAQKAGLKAGDVIIQLGSHTINSLENYMQALGTFKKGDKTTVKYKRGNETLEANVDF
jgi:hypothetical protein